MASTSMTVVEKSAEGREVRCCIGGGRASRGRGPAARCQAVQMARLHQTAAVIDCTWPHAPASQWGAQPKAAWTLPGITRECGINRAADQHATGIQVPPPPPTSRRCLFGSRILALQYKVKDMSQADFGRLEIEMAEAEMPGLMACRTEFGAKQPFKGAPT